VLEGVAGKGLRDSTRKGKKMSFITGKGGIVSKTNTYFERASGGGQKLSTTGPINTERKE